jgi:transposase
MKKKKNLIKKVKLLLKKTNMPKYLHHFGPKLYQLWQHVFALFFKANCKLSYRRTTGILRELGFNVASKSTLQRYASKLKIPFWKQIFNLTIGKNTSIFSIDGTGLEKTISSKHYIKRIDSEYKFSQGFHFSIVVDNKGKIQGLRLRKNHGSDVKDIRCLYRNLINKPKIILMDKGYDAEWIHELFEDNGIRSIAPTRKNAKKGFFRKKLIKNFPKKLYGKRNMVESVFHAFKQKYGSNIFSKNIASARSEVYCKAILHNLSFKILRLLGQTLFFRKLFIDSFSFLQ